MSHSWRILREGRTRVEGAQMGADMTDLDVKYDVDHRSSAFEDHLRGLLVSLAGPGTGKTHSLLGRIAALAKRGTPFNTICYVTFINEIARAFESDYRGTLGGTAGAPRISTLHSFACRVLRNLGHQIGYSGALYFGDMASSSDIAARVFLEDLLPGVAQQGCRTVPQLRKLIEQVEAAWRTQTLPTALPNPIPAILPAAQDLLRCYRLVDWDQAISLAESLLRGGGGLPDWIAKIGHYVVDEYQDFNAAEQALISLMTHGAESVVVVGDDDQSVYSGRSA